MVVVTADNAHVDEANLRERFAKKLITSMGTRATVVKGTQETEEISNEVIDLGG